MPEPARPVFLVDAYSDPALVRVDGRASFQNSACLRDFFAELIRQGKRRFAIDFRSCMGMDSTFLGTLAGAALELRKLDPPGSLVLCRLGPRNLELVRNLGLHRLMTVDAGERDLSFSAGAQQLDCPPATDEVESARLVLEAHENLVAADEDNRRKFQDVLAYLKNRIEQG
jgi:anti-sigma B factor antagonist